MQRNSDRKPPTPTAPEQGHSGLPRNRQKPRMGILLCCGLFSSLFAIAQPSGGPYGPVAQTYDLPRMEGTIYYVDPDGKAEETGETLSKPTTIEAALERAVTGDAIVLRGGTYRTGDLEFNQGILMQPYADEKPVLKGTQVASDWTDMGNNLWTTTWDHLFPSGPADWWRRHRAGKETPLHRFNNDMVFIDGKFLKSAGWEGEVNENTYYIDYETKTVYIGTDPTDRLVEITAFNRALTRTNKPINGKEADRKGPVIRGITITQYAFRGLEVLGSEPEGPANEADFGKDVIGTTVEHCTLSYCGRVGGYFRGDGLTVRYCRVSDTGTEGIYIVSSSDILLEKNILTRNNIERITGYYPATVKIFNQCHRATCRDNLVIDLPYSNGIWYDVGNVDGYIINNRFQNVTDPLEGLPGELVWKQHNNALFFEISKGAICAGNLFVDCSLGVCVLNSSDAQVYQNTFINSSAAFCRTDRGLNEDHFGWHPSTGPAVHERDGHAFANNLFSGTSDFDRSFLYVWQPDTLHEHVATPQLSRYDYNLYVHRSEPKSNPFIAWTPASADSRDAQVTDFKRLQELHPAFSVHSEYLPSYSGSLFKSPETGRYELIANSAAAKPGAPLPDEITKLLEGPESFIGAYPANARVTEMKPAAE